MQIKPIPVQKSLVLINNFIVNTSLFLNSFSESVEQKISSVSSRITDIEILLSILEEKLNSIPEADGVGPSSPLDSSPALPAAPAAIAATPPLPAPADAPTPAPTPAAASIEEPPATGGDSLLNHPDYQPFVKMIKVGVPKFIVVGKATAAGLDGSVLEAYEA